ncbi:MAG: acyltransferase [Acutalibacteraceae bacterium]
MMEKKERLIYADILRIVSIFGVLVIHSVSLFWRHIPIKTVSWAVFACLDSVFRFSVPVFIMISGMFMLSPEKDRGIKNLYSKNILHIFTSFVFWSFLYALFNSIPTNPEISFSTRDFILRIIKGEYHLWFLFMIAGLYIVTPILRKIVDDKKLTEYFLAIWFVFCLFANFTKLIPFIGDTIFEFFEGFRISDAIGYSGFYILGYYLNKYPLSKKFRISVYILGFLSIAFSALATVYSSFSSMSTQIKFLNYLLPTTLFSSCSIFIFVQHACEKRSFSEKKKRAIAALSKYSFGVYLCHIFVFNTFKRLDIIKLDLPYILIFFIALISTVIISTIVSAILNHIPVLKKYIV